MFKLKANLDFTRKFLLKILEILFMCSTVHAVRKSAIDCNAESDME